LNDGVDPVKHRWKTAGLCRSRGRRIGSAVDSRILRRRATKLKQEEQVTESHQHPTRRPAPPSALRLFLPLSRWGGDSIHPKCMMDGRRIIYNFSLYIVHDGAEITIRIRTTFSRGIYLVVVRNRFFLGGKKRKKEKSRSCSQFAKLCQNGSACCHLQ